MNKNAFERYAPFIQQYIYYKKWISLKEVQVEACEAILDTNNHVIIASGTASGKTEAAFFPILTLLNKKPANSIGVMYIGPLKALINNQFERLNELLRDNTIPVWAWHGDIAQSVKKKALRVARGIMQITPESLEAMLMRNPGDACRLFSDLRFIVIDEIHALMGQDRGAQVLCLLARLEKLIARTPRRIGLSATLNDYQPAMNFLAAGTHTKTVAVGLRAHKRTISLCVESFIMPENEDEQIDALKQYNEFIYNNCRTKKCLIFANTRMDSEATIISMKNIAKAKGDNEDIFYVHHGNISAAMRCYAEHALHDNYGPTVTAATLTLELGIDIGDLDSIIQLGAPCSSSSFVQRMGRSGRRTGKSQMMFLNLKKEKYNNPLDNLPWDLLRSIAIIQLYLEERWVEPFELKKKPFSLLAHQTLSTLIAYGELSPRELAQKVLSLPPFKDIISQDEYKELLCFMLEKEYIQRMDEGEIIAGLKGEKLANNFSFYTVFKDDEEFCVRSQFEEIGTLHYCPAIDEIFVLAGFPWITVSIDKEQKVVYVKRSKTNIIPQWNAGEYGNIHSKILGRMKEVLRENIVYPYLQSTAIKLLNEARVYATESGLLEHSILPYEEKSFFIIPWTGTKEIITIHHLLTHGLKETLDIFAVDIAPKCPYYLSVKSGISINDFICKLKSIQVAWDNPNTVLSENQSPIIDKYDFMVPKTLLRTAFLANRMNISAALQILNNLK